MLWDTIVGQEEAKGYLQKALKGGNLSHAYLFGGPEGVGKKTTAKTWLAALICKRGGCGWCPCCLKIAKEVHPDVHHLEPEGNFVTIAQVRELKRRASLKPLQGEVSFFILDEVEKMTPPAANALLKILEDPPAPLIFVLITSQVEALLETIVSRCQLVRFKAIPPTKIAQLLIKFKNVSEPQAKFIARISGGTFGQALRWLSCPEKLPLRDEVLNMAQQLSRASLVQLLQTSEHLLFGVKRSLEKLRQRQKEELRKGKELAINPSHAAYIRRRFKEKHKREIDREERQGFEEILSVFSSWYRDLLVLKQGIEPSLIVNLDKIEKLKEFSGKITSLQAQKAIQIVEKTREMLRLNVNKSLALEGMFLELQEV